MAKRDADYHARRRSQGFENAQGFNKISNGQQPSGRRQREFDPIAKRFKTPQAAGDGAEKKVEDNHSNGQASTPQQSRISVCQQAQASLKGQAPIISNYTPSSSCK